jgi:hypothetical protein
LIKIGKKLKKNNVSIDIVSFGDCAEANKERLEAFVAAVNKDSNSHFVEAPMGSNLCDFLLSTPVISQAGMDGGGGSGGGATRCSACAPRPPDRGTPANLWLQHVYCLLHGRKKEPAVSWPVRSSFQHWTLSSVQVWSYAREQCLTFLPLAASGEGGGYEFGVDPNLDPEMAMVLRISMEEEQARQQAAAQAAAGEGGSAATPAAEATDSAAPTAAALAPAAADAAEGSATPMEEDEDMLLAQALALSMQVTYVLNILAIVGEMEAEGAQWLACRPGESLQCGVVCRSRFGR